MTLITKNGMNLGSISNKNKGDKIDIYRKFISLKNQKPEEHIEFEGEVGGQRLGIRIRRGSWEIMAAIVPMVLKYCPGDIVEIGMGESTEILADIAYQNGVNLYSCDIQIGGMFKVFDAPLFENHYCFTEGSDAFMKEFGGSPSVVFIDGEHKYETVKKETKFFLSKMRPGGVMFMHDTMPVFKRNIEPDSKGYNPGDIYKVRQELERNPRYDVLTFPYSASNMGLTMIMVHDSERPYWRENGRGIDEID